MNKSYVSIWSEALGSWVAASENTVTRGKLNKARVCAVVATAVVAAASWAPVAHAQYNAGGGELTSRVVYGQLEGRRFQAASFC
ncbi:hypothetical protein OKW43_000350 [Paraburkholderia sp. WC7.3g]|uniref:ESPR domain-containing protein n=1 Tax=Paraburkholderia sp. WC7.3g TaxID=2991070 RepID=UPI003D1EF735